MVNRIAFQRVRAFPAEGWRAAGVRQRIVSKGLIRLRPDAATTSPKGRESIGNPTSERVASPAKTLAGDPHCAAGTTGVPREAVRAIHR